MTETPELDPIEKLNLERAYQIINRRWAEQPVSDLQFEIEATRQKIAAIDTDIAFNATLPLPEGETRDDFNRPFYVARLAELEAALPSVEAVLQAVDKRIAEITDQHVQMALDRETA